jgi:hypothetical protein
MQCVAILKNNTILEYNILHNDLFLNMDYELRSSLGIFIQSNHSNIPMKLTLFKVSLADDQKFTIDVGFKITIIDANDETFRAYIMCISEVQSSTSQ